MKYYTAEQLGKIFNKSVDTMRRKICAGEFGETLNDGRTHMVSEEGLQNYIEKHTGPAHYKRNFSNAGTGKRNREPARPIRRLTLDDLRSDVS